MRADLGTWQTIVAFFVSVAAFIAALAVINNKVIAPWVAKPVAKAVRSELVEFIEIAFLGSEVLHEHIREATEEIVTKEMKVVVEMLQDHEKRLESIEDNTQYVRDRMESRPPRDDHKHTR